MCVRERAHARVCVCMVFNCIFYLLINFFSKVDVWKLEVAFIYRYVYMNATWYQYYHFILDGMQTFMVLESKDLPESFQGRQLLRLLINMRKKMFEKKRFLILKLILSLKYHQSFKVNPSSYISLETDYLHVLLSRIWKAYKYREYNFSTNIKLLKKQLILRSH